MPIYGYDQTTFDGKTTLLFEKKKIKKIKLQKGGQWVLCCGHCCGISVLKASKSSLFKWQVAHCIRIMVIFVSENIDKLTK